MEQENNCNYLVDCFRVAVIHSSCGVRVLKKRAPRLTVLGDFDYSVAAMMPIIRAMNRLNI